VAEQVLSGLRYLAERGCLHRDLAARNILVAGPIPLARVAGSEGAAMEVDQLEFKIADFGMSR